MQYGNIIKVIHTFANVYYHTDDGYLVRILHVIFPSGKISISSVSHRFIKIASCRSAIGVSAVPPIFTKLGTGRVSGIVLARW